MDHVYGVAFVCRHWTVNRLAFYANGKSTVKMITQSKCSICSFYRFEFSFYFVFFLLFVKYTNTELSLNHWYNIGKYPRSKIRIRFLLHENNSKWNLMTDHLNEKFFHTVKILMHFVREIIVLRFYHLRVALRTDSFLLPIKFRIMFFFRKNDANYTCAFVMRLSVFIAWKFTFKSYLLMQWCWQTSHLD